MKHYIRAILLACILLATALPLSAQPFRSITSAEWSHYSYGEDALRLEEVGIYRLNEVWSVVAKAEWDAQPNRETVKGMAGVVFTLFDYSYMETSYGVAFTQGSELSHHLLVDYYYDRDDFYLLAGAKAQLSAAQQTYQPSLAGKWWISPSFSLWGKYITSFDTQVGFDHSFWGEGAYRLHKAFKLKAGGTIGSYHPDADSARELEYSGLGGLSFTPADDLSLSLEFEYLQRKSYAVASTGLIADLRF
jgi:opacity protein-like surface antigen